VDARSAESLLGLIEDAAPGLRGLDTKAAFARIEERYENVEAALGWFVDEGRADEALRLAAALMPFWMASKRHAEGSGWFERIVELPGADDARRARGLYGAGYLAFWHGDDDRSSEFTQKALDLGRRIGDATVIALALAVQARVALRRDVEEARRLCLEALAVTEGTGDREGRSSALHVIGVASQMAGDLEAARGYMIQRIDQAREAGNFATISAEAGNLSMVERQLGNLDRAEGLSREAIDIDQRRGDELSIAWKLNGLAALMAERGEHERAATVAAAANAQWTSHSDAWPPDEQVQYDRTIATLTREMTPEAFERAQAAGRSMTTSDAVDYALERSKGVR
jgi:tetratricopeptide (TPR) repeat protein